MSYDKRINSLSKHLKYTEHLLDVETDKRIELDSKNEQLQLQLEIIKSQLEYLKEENQELKRAYNRLDRTHKYTVITDWHCHTHEPFDVYEFAANYVPPFPEVEEKYKKENEVFDEDYETEEETENETY